MKQIPESGLIIFDGSCGVCSTFIGRRAEFFKRHGFSIVPLQEPWIRELTGLEECDLLQAIHLYTKDGEVLKGIDFIEKLASKVWWMYPIYLLMQIRVLKSIFAWLYAKFADNRQQISKICKLKSTKD